MSKDDDFCSRCGSAVYDNDNISSSDDISCSNYSGHSHEKQSFQNGSSYNYNIGNRNYSEQYKSAQNSKVNKKGLFWTIVIIVLWMSGAIFGLIEEFLDNVGNF